MIRIWILPTIVYGLSMDWNLTEKEKGNRGYAYQCPKLVAKILRDLKLFPLWGNAYQSKFGHGRVPATSAPSESEFNKLKNVLLRKEKLRVDNFLIKHVGYLEGKVKLVDAAEIQKISMKDDTEIFHEDNQTVNQSNLEEVC